MISGDSIVDMTGDIDKVKTERDISISEIMSYQDPKWMAWVGFLASVVASA